MLDTIVRGVVTGAVGTLAMDLLWDGRYGRVGGKDGVADWEFANNYVTLGALAVDEPIWEYDVETLGKDPSGHPWVATAVAHDVISRP